MARPKKKELLFCYDFFFACKSTLKDILLKESIAQDKTRLARNIQRFEWEVYHVLEREYEHLKMDVEWEENKKAPLSKEC